MASGETEHGREAWDEFARRANEFIESEDLERSQIDFKVEIAHEIARAQAAVLTCADDWAQLVKSGLDNILIFPDLQKKLHSWIDESPDDALSALQAIWTEDALSVTERIRTFSTLFPKSVSNRRDTRMAISSVLLMGLDFEQYPPFRAHIFNEAYVRTGYDYPAQDADEATLYKHALGFLDRLSEEARIHGVLLRHRLDAQSVVWQLTHELPDYCFYTDPHPDPIVALAESLHICVPFLEEIEVLLYDKRQVIFQGPPGTGKTYVAQELAECLAGGNENRVTLVQFHPSYAYEDFVRGFRPSIEGGQAGFELQDGPLLQAAEKARADKEVDPEAKHFLIIDEINRGNIAKVFGELYFLLEYRDKKINLQYQREPGETFSLPENLYIIGTMNTADRSIALVDLALRRRFYFIEFHPDDEPVKSVLRKWLGEGSELEWVADVVEEANRQLEEYKHAAIGPSYFMKDGLREEDVPRVWKHSVLPYIEELLFGDDTKIQQLQLKELCETVAPHINWSDGDEKKDDNAISNSEVVNDATDQPSGVPGEQSSPS